MKKKVLYIQPLHGSGMHMLEEKYEVIVANSEDKKVLLSMIPEVNAIVSRLTVIDEDMIFAGKNLQAIAKHGVGVDNIDVTAATKRGIAVLTTGNANSISVAEHAFFAIGALCKRVNYLDHEMRKGNWESRDTRGSVDLIGKKIGIVGFGKIGMNIAKMAKQGFSMEVMIYDPYADRENVEALGYAWVAELTQICREADVLTVHVPLSQETVNLIDRNQISLMKPTAYMVNFARGGIVNEKALYEALVEKRITAAALDVFEEEPPDYKSSLFRLDNVLLSPHCGTFSEDSRIRMSMQVAEGIDDVLSGAVPKFAVNKKEIYGE